MPLVFKLRQLLVILALCFATSALAVPAEGTRIMISAPSDYAVNAGKRAWDQGGNLIDVAVAVGLALAVTNPSNASLGGGGFALISMGDGVDVLDFREAAPAATSPEFYLEREKGASWNGGAAIGVPGVAAGYWAMHEKYGKLPWAQLFETALGLANDGIEFSGTESRYAESQKDRLNAGGKPHFFKASNEHYRPGETFRQPALGKALTLLRDQGTGRLLSRRRRPRQSPPRCRPTAASSPRTTWPLTGYAGWTRCRRLSATTACT